jgi:uncharacterized protein (TIGR04255 family)
MQRESVRNDDVGIISLTGMNTEAPDAAAIVRFNKPPVVEVVCGVQFDEIPGWSTGHYGLLWERFRDDYPTSEDHPPLEPFRFREGDGRGEQTFLGTMPPMRRVWLVGKPLSFVIQMQPDRFLLNWRRATEEDTYPTFEGTFARFRAAWMRFTSAVAEFHLPAPRPTGFELTYVDHIVDLSGDVDGTYPIALKKYLNISLPPAIVAGSKRVSIDLKFASQLPENLGRFSVSIRTGKRKTDKADVLLLEMTARGPADSNADSNMEHWFHSARRNVRDTFMRLTTEKAHDLWGRQP